jgi:hypothetical protein
VDEACMSVTRAAVTCWKFCVWRNRHMLQRQRGGSSGHQVMTKWQPMLSATYVMPQTPCRHAAELYKCSFKTSCSCCPCCCCCCCCGW